MRRDFRVDEATDSFANRHDDFADAAIIRVR